MKKGHFVKLTCDGSTIAGSTSISMNIQAEMIEVTSIPGSAEDDGWLHYEYGGVAWGATSDGFYSADVTLVSKIVQGQSNVSLEMPISDSYKLTGDGILAEMAIMGDIASMSRMSVKFVGDGMPSITTAISRRRGRKIKQK